MAHIEISGVYPHLAVTHHDESQAQNECGIGAVVNFHGKLYWITYPASVERGGEGRIYSLDENMTMTECAQSTGGTHADRMIHRQGDALILGANVIFADGTVKAFDVKKMIGRLTGAAPHPKADEGWVYIASMEDGLYEANINTMEIRTLREDIIDRLRIPGVRPENRRGLNKLDGDHAKGLYAAQGVVMYTNNGHGGVLAEWDGTGDAQDKKNWKVIERTNFTEVTGPGGIEGPESEDDPVWSLGWDKRSVLLCVRSADGEWMRYRLPKASYTQDADHGWFTEWPRIRKVYGKYLMCMHGMIYEFPETFKKGAAGGIKPIARHLKMISDYAEWNGKIAFACDDASGFDNPEMGRCQSNLWFSTFDELKTMSAPSGWGGLYVREPTIEGSTSDPFFVGGFEQKVLYLHVLYEGGNFVLEMDRDGSGSWQKVRDISVSANQAMLVDLPQEAQWIRLTVDRDLSECTVYVYLAMNEDTGEDQALKAGLSCGIRDENRSAGRLITLLGEELKLGYLSDDGYYEIGGGVNWLKKDAPAEVLDKAHSTAQNPIHPRCRLTGHSVLVIDTDGKKYHLPYLPSQTDARLFVREVVTERSLMNLCGTIYELPRPESCGVLRIKPVTTHDCAIEDFVSWRGMLVMSGVDKTSDGAHVFKSADGKAAVWCGVVDDLWRFGTPRGMGGPLKETALMAGEASDPFLLAGYRHKSLELSHDLAATVTFTMECDFAAIGCFAPCRSFEVKPGETLRIDFDENFVSHWVRFKTDRDCRATALFTLK